MPQRNPRVWHRRHWPQLVWHRRVWRRLAWRQPVWHHRLAWRQPVWRRPSRSSVYPRAWRPRRRSAAPSPAALPAVARQQETRERQLACISSSQQVPVDVASVNLLVTNGAVLEASEVQVVEGRRRDSARRVGVSWSRADWSDIRDRSGTRCSRVNIRDSPSHVGRGRLCSLRSAPGHAQK